MAYRNSLACILFLLGNLSLADDKSGIAEKHRLDIQELMQSITSAEYVGREPLRDLETLAKLPAVGDFLDSLATEFATEIKSGNQPYRNLEGTIGHARRRISEFEAALKNYASLSSLTEDVEHTRAMLAMAIENQAPAYFREGSDIANRRLAIDFKLAVIDKVASPRDLAKAKELSSQLASEVKAAHIKLSEQIIGSNELPLDGYRLFDRKQLLVLVESTWNKAAPERIPLHIGLIGDSWSRSLQWEIQNRSLYKVDRSELQGYVLVTHDQQTLVCYRVQIRRDHIDNDRTTTWLLSDIKQPPTPTELVLASKKP